MSDNTRKVQTQRGDKVNLSGVQLYFTENQLLFLDEQLKSRTEQLQIGSGQPTFQGDQLQI